MKVLGGTIVDATRIAAPPETKSHEESIGPAVHQTQKGHFFRNARACCRKVQTPSITSTHRSSTLMSAG
jgi:hypothetical protein